MAASEARSSYGSTEPEPAARKPLVAMTRGACVGAMLMSAAWTAVVCGARRTYASARAPSSLASEHESSADPAREKATIQRPHIFLFLVDDVGHNDFGYQSADMSDPSLTPYIDSLAADGVRLDRHYTHSECTPSRAALLTGMYASSVGMDQSSIKSDSPFGLHLEWTLMPEVLHSIGYVTHAIGKWDLGHYARPYWPTSRGFSSYFGLLSTAYRSYTNHTVADWSAGCDDDAADSTCSEAGRFEPVSLVRNFEPASGYEGIYSTTLFGNEAASVLARHNTSENSEMPLFLYLAFNAPHAPVEIEEGFHATDAFKGLKANAKDPARRQFAGAL